MSHELTICVLWNIANQSNGEVDDFSGIECREGTEVFHWAKGQRRFSLSRGRKWRHKRWGIQKILSHKNELSDHAEDIEVDAIREKEAWFWHQRSKDALCL